MSERKEALMRVVVLIISGIVLSLWRVVIQVIVVIHWIYVLVFGMRNRGLAEFCDMWTAQVYEFLQYITFMNNKRPFPFAPLKKTMDKYQR